MGCLDMGPQWRENGAEMWLSTRGIRRRGDPEWDPYIHTVGLMHLWEVRTIDSWCNPCLEGHYPVYTLEELWERMKLLPEIKDDRSYHLVFMDASRPGGVPQHDRLKLLGYDLSDETWTSSLLNCGRWQGPLESIAKKTQSNGLLGLSDAKLAQTLLPQVRPGDPHSNVTVWALLEVLPEPRGG